MMQKLKEAIVLTFAYYGKDITEAVLNLYLEDLAGHEPSVLINAYNTWRRNPENRNPPLPAQIIGILDPSKFISSRVAAAEIASKIVAAVPKFGWANPKEAREFIGELGWLVVEQRGGWLYLCENLGLELNPSIYEAQCRDTVQARIELAGGYEKAVLLAQQPKEKLPDAMSDVLKLAQESCRKL